MNCVCPAGAWGCGGAEKGSLDSFEKVLSAVTAIPQFFDSVFWEAWNLSALTPALLERIHNTIRFLSIDAIEKAKSGHPGAPMGLAAPVFEIWDQHLCFDPSDPAWAHRDRFVLSGGHASMLLYSLLHLFGYDVSLDEIKNFRQLGSRTPGHPEFGHTPGVEVTTGPLGQGFAHAVGMALAAKMTHSRFGAARLSSGTGAVMGPGPGTQRIYGTVGDGDLMEGISAEAAALAGVLELGNLIFLYDSNQISIDGATRITFSENIRARFEAQHWHVEHVSGEDLPALRRALEAAKAETKRPSLIICDTVIGRGSPNKAGTSATHGSPLGPDEALATKRAAGWPENESFFVPTEVRAYLAERIAAKKQARAKRDAEIAAWKSENPALAAQWESFRAQRLPADLTAVLAQGMAEAKDATRKHSSTLIQRIAEAVPFVVGGSADLACSNLTTINKTTDIGPAAGDADWYAGRNIHFGVREHVMGAIANGIALDGTFLPFVGTFLVFSDYVRPAVRLAALMGVRNTFVFTHDSIFLGEDGPTHQPIEHVDSLRLIPNLYVFRPADGLETALAWAWSLQKAKGPVALALSRQTLPPLARPATFASEDIWRGAYIVQDCAGTPDVVFVASGSEVSLSLEAAQKLASDGKQVRVVSLPCLELFLEQPETYRKQVVPTGSVPVVAVEAGSARTLYALVGGNGFVYGIDRFGASAPPSKLAEVYGFTPDALVKRVREFLAK